MAEVFLTGWFVESLLTELLILFVIRTYKPFYRSRPGRFLVWSTSGVAVLALLLPYLPIAAVFGFVPLPATLLVSILVITVRFLSWMPPACGSCYKWSVCTCRFGLLSRVF
ncbi:MAG: cation transporting ATPase C-terminal domain-containing protein [Gammaproteobacteria bacterium]